MNIEELETRVRILEDIEAIKKLRAKYCYYVDAGKMDELLSLFAENARGDYGVIGIYEGKEALEKFFKETVPGMVPFCMHMVHSPLIEVKGEKATGIWYFEVPATHGPTNKAAWIAGKYEEEYIKEKGEWKFSLVKAIFNYFTPYEEGWAKTRMMA